MANLCRIAVSLAALLALTAGRVSAQQPPEELRCLDLTLGPWTGSGDPELDSIYRMPPPRVELLARPEGPARSRMLEVREVDGAVPSVHDFSSWRLSPGLDTLYLAWSTGFSGFSGRLLREDGRYRGRVESFTDVVGQPPDSAELVATPVDCGASLPERFTRQRPVPQGVRLVTGDSVRLGMPLDDVADVETIAGYRMVRLRTALAAPFAGASQVELLPDAEGRLAIIRFHLPSGTEFEPLVQAIVRDYGPPASRRPNPPRALPGEWVTWANRTSGFSLHRTRSEDGGEMVGVLLSLHRFPR